MRFLIMLFIFELFFGFNGKWLMIGGISVRHWLFAAVLCAVYGKALYFFAQKHKREKDNSLKSYLRNELRSFKAFDWFLAAFAALHSIWILVIPYLQQENNPGALKYAIGSGLCIILILLYFPAVYLLRNGQVPWEKYVRFTMGCCVALAVLHPVLYVLETMQWNNDHSVYFMERVFTAWGNLVDGHYDQQAILMPFYSVRIIYPFTIFIVMSFYFIVGRTEKRYVFWTLLNIVALLATGTRSHSLSVIVGVCAFGLLNILIHRRTKLMIKRNLMLSLGILIFILVVDAVAFRGMNVTRMLASFKVSEEVLDKGEAQSLIWEDSKYSAEKEIRGTANSNSTRIILIRGLWQKIMERPLLGHGFTLSVCDMQGLNYIAKVGLVGMALWIAFLVVLLKRVIRMEKQVKGSGLPAIYPVAAILFDTQLQCVFGSLTMAAAVFVFLDLENKELEIQRRPINEISNLCVND